MYKRETENKLLAKTKRIAELYSNLAIAGIIGLVILLGFILVNQRLRIQRRVKNTLEEEVAVRTKEIFQQKETIFHTNLRLKLALNGAKFDSHFAVNVLTSIQEVILQRPSQEAQQYLPLLSQVMQYVLEHAPLNKVFLREELQMAEHYIQLEQLRMDNRFSYSIAINADAKTPIPALVLQPYIEAAILHGLAMATGTDLHLHLQAESTSDVLTFIITENGADSRKDKQKRYCPLGQERLDLLTHLTHKTTWFL